jgi:hypothetical protein
VKKHKPNTTIITTRGKERSLEMRQVTLP